MVSVDVQSEEVFELLDLGIGVFDESLRLRHCNPAFKSLRRYPDAVCRSGVTLEALLRHNAERGDFGPGDAGAQVAERMAEINVSGTRDLEREMADGQILHISYRRTRSGGLVVTFDDRTAERRAEAALRASEERYALVSDAAEEAIYDWHIKERRFFASARLQEVLGREVGGEGGRDWDWAENVHPDDIGRYSEMLEAHISGIVPRWSCEYRLKDAQGAWRWVSDHGTSIRGGDGRAIRMVAAIRDITERVERDAALAASEERHALVTKATSDGIYDWNITDDVLYVSDNLMSLLDFDLSRGRSAMWAERIHPDDHADYIASLRAHLRGEADVVEHEYRVRAKGGGYRWVFDRGVGVRGPDGRVTRLVGAVRDITGMRQARAEFERVQGRLIGSLETIADGILLVGGDDRVELFNDRYVEIFSQAAGGADLSDLVVAGRDFFEMIRDGYELGMFKPHAGGVDDWIARRRQAWQRPVANWELELANGAWILLNERRMPDGGRISVYTDITEFKRREAEAQAARRRFEEAIEAISSGFALWDADDRLVVSNARYRTYFADLADMVTPGTAFTDIVVAGIERGMFPLADGNVEGYMAAIAEKRLNARGEPREQFIGGLWLQVTDHRTADGGIVSIYTDITELKTKQMEVENQTAILELTLENMGQGITLVDKDLRAIALNQKFLELMQFPPEQFKRGFTMEQAFRYNAERGEYGPGDIEEQVRVRVGLAAKFQAHKFERTRPDGSVIEIVGNPIKGGGFVSTYTDITGRKRAEEALKAALAEFNAVLELDRLRRPFHGPRAAGAHREPCLRPDLEHPAGLHRAAPEHAGADRIQPP